MLKYLGVLTCLTYLLYQSLLNGVLNVLACSRARVLRKCFGVLACLEFSCA